MLLRIRGPDGMIRLTVDHSTTFGELGDLVSPSIQGPTRLMLNANLQSQLLPQLPTTVEPSSILLSNSPNGGDAKALPDIAKFKVEQIGLK